ncbi:hypothetical protein [Bradyrhizobium sp. RT9a]|uniref:hypothetical protein n=1 Tax=Bradyrhizobium sp. RT9a TaxID=3156384 RepID=UPI00339543A7
MTGFNHYLNCTCGWCVNYGRMSPATRGRLLGELRHRDAVNLLKVNSARSISGCYVNPNAKCPVCREAVYFYANEHGSRVFFDDLGPPWPKHSCTDNPREPLASRGAPTRRTRGMMQELVEAANTAGLFRNKAFGRRIPTEWTLLIVVSVDRDGDENIVEAEFLDSQSGETTQFKCRSDEPVLEPGDFVNIRGKEISFVHKAKLIPVTFTDGVSIVIPEKPPEPPPPPPAPPPSPAAPPKATPKTVFPKRNKPADYSRSPMIEAEMVHYNSEAVGLGDLLAKLDPLVRAYAREQTRKPVDVSLRLNAEGHKTAAGAPWTPRLVYFLLALIFDSPRADGYSKPRPPRPAGLAGAKSARLGAVKISMDDNRPS